MYVSLDPRINEDDDFVQDFVHSWEEDSPGVPDVAFLGGGHFLPFPHLLRSRLRRIIAGGEITSFWSPFPDLTSVWNPPTVSQRILHLRSEVGREKKKKKNLLHKNPNNLPYL